MNCPCGDTCCNCLLTCCCSRDLCTCRLCCLARNDCCCICGLPCDTVGQNVCQCFLELAASSLPASPIPIGPDPKDEPTASDQPPPQLVVEDNSQVYAEKDKCKEEESYVSSLHVESTSIPNARHCSARTKIQDLGGLLVSGRVPTSRRAQFTGTPQNITNQFPQVNKDGNMTLTYAEIVSDKLARTESQDKGQSLAGASTAVSKESTCSPKSIQAQKHKDSQEFFRAVELQPYSTSSSPIPSSDIQTCMTRQNPRRSSVIQNLPKPFNTSPRRSSLQNILPDASSVGSHLQLPTGTREILEAYVAKTQGCVIKPKEEISEQPLDYSIKRHLNPNPSITTESNVSTLKIQQFDKTSAEVPSSHGSPMHRTKPFYFPNNPPPFYRNQGTVPQVPSVVTPLLPASMFSPSGFLDYSRFPHSIPPPFKSEKSVTANSLHAAVLTQSQVRASIQQWLSCIPDRPPQSLEASGSAADEDLCGDEATSEGRFQNRYAAEKKATLEGRFRERSPINQEFSPSARLDEKNRAMFDKKNSNSAKKSKNASPAKSVSSTVLSSNDPPPLTREFSRVETEFASTQTAEEGSESKDKIQKESESEVLKTTVSKRQSKDKKD